MKIWGYKNVTFIFPGTRQSYAEPQNLTEMVREVLKDKKPLADKTADKPADKPADMKIDKKTTESEEEVKKRSKI